MLEESFLSRNDQLLFAILTDNFFDIILVDYDYPKGWKIRGLTRFSCLTQEISIPGSYLLRLNCFLLLLSLKEKQFCSHQVKQ